MAPPTQTRRVIRFGAFEVDPQSGELRKQGLRVKLQEQPFQVLLLLLERPGEVVTREDLRQKLWPADTFVDFDTGLNSAILKLRHALEDSADNARFVETLPRRGYRFIAPVEKDGWLEAVLAAVAPSLGAKWIGRGLTLGAGLVAVLGVLLGLNVGGFRERFFGGTTSAHIQSIAVLPLENLTGDPNQEYFVDGMTDELITNLAQIKALRVISRTSVMRFKGARRPLPQIARELNVDAVVEGSVARAGSRVRVRAQLVDTATDQHLWAQSFEGDLRDVLSLQEGLARAITTEIGITLTPQEQARLANARAVNPEAYELYLLGRFYLAKRMEDGMKKAAELFRQAIAKNPGYALAYAALGQTYELQADFGFDDPKEARPKAEAAARKALELDDTLAEAYTVLATIAEGYYCDPAESERYFRRALELNPGYATAHHWFARLLSPEGRHAEAVAEILRARELDPLSLIINDNVAEIYTRAGQYDKALEQLRKTLDMDPNYARTHLDLGLLYEQMGRYDDAFAELQKARALGGENWPEFREPLQRAYEQGGFRGYAQAELKLLLDRSKRKFVHPATIAGLYAFLGQKEEAVAWLEKAYQEGYCLTGLINGDPDFRPLQEDPRFQDLLRRLEQQRRPSLPLPSTGTASSGAGRR